MSSKNLPVVVQKELVKHKGIATYFKRLQRLVNQTQGVIHPNVIPTVEAFPFLRGFDPNLYHPEDYLEQIVKECQERKRRDIKSVNNDILVSLARQYINLNQKEKGRKFSWTYDEAPKIPGGIFTSEITLADLIYRANIKDLLCNSLPNDIKKRNPLVRNDYRLHCYSFAELLNQERQPKFETAKQQINSRWNKVITKLPEKVSDLKQTLENLSKEGYYSATLLTHPIPVGLLEDVKEVSPIHLIPENCCYDSYYPTRGYFYYIKTNPLVITPLPYLTSKSRDGQYVVTQAKVIACGFPEMDVNARFEKRLHVEAEMSGFSFGFLPTALGLKGEAKAVLHDKFRVYSNRKSRVSVIIGDDNVAIPCTFNHYDLPNIPNYNVRTTLTMLRGYDDGDPTFNRTVHPNQVDALLKSAKDHMIVVGGKVNQGVLNIDFVFDPKSNIIFQYSVDPKIGTDINYLPRFLQQK